jgi:hypothetical protein
MIADDQELNAALERIRHLQGQVAHLRQVETNRPIPRTIICRQPVSWPRLTECSWRCASTSRFTPAN